MSDEKWNPAERLVAAEDELERLAEQINCLANFIMAEVEGEPSRSEGAVECAIRIMRSQQARLAHLDQEETQEALQAALGYARARKRAMLVGLPDKKDSAWHRRVRVLQGLVREEH